MYQTSNARWGAISQRDPAAHCSFIYGVKTTKIYCRPTCTARLARRANVVYYDTIEQAQRDGFRACQRCKPDDVTFFGQREEVVLGALGLLKTKQNDATMKWSLKELAKELGVTPSYLCRVFKKTMGTTIGEYTRRFESEVTAEETSLSPESTGSSTVSSGIQPLTPGIMSPFLSNQNQNQPGSIQTPIDTGTCTVGLSDQISFGAADGAPMSNKNSPSSCVDPVVQHQGQSDELVNLDLDLDFDDFVAEECFDLNEWVRSSCISNSHTTL